jgi:NAD(P)-dependent dehydrogenase (short-subunit alcohol dehydrogenase family)
MRAFLPGMVRRGGGRVVAVGSRTALRPYAGASAYAASKAGLIALVAAASEEVKHDGVTVNCVLPSVIDTPANRAAMGDADHSRWVKPEEIGHVVRFLASPEASAVTGAALPVYGRA